jgi:hypothetical protein
MFRNPERSNLGPSHPYQNLSNHPTLNSFRIREDIMAPPCNKENNGYPVNSSYFDSGFALTPNTNYQARDSTLPQDLGFYSQTKNPLGSLSQSDYDFQKRLANLDKRLNMYESPDENINISKNTNFCMGAGVSGANV